MTRRSRFGCRTCKIRRVKCDESLPHCRRCSETGRQCDGPPKNKTIFMKSISALGQQRVPSTSNNSLSSDYSLCRQLTTVPDLHDADRRSLTFFVECAGPALGGELDQEFWHTSVLQLSHRSTMVRAAILAVSMLYENPLSNPLSWPSSPGHNFRKLEHQQAFRWYSESLNGMSEVMQLPQNQEQLQLALTTCILFASVEFQQLNVVNSMQLMKCGYGLLRQDTARALMMRSPVVRNTILPIFVRQTIVLLIHGHHLPQGWLPPDLTTLGPSSAISSLQNARTHLYLLMLGGFGIIGSACATSDPTIIIQLRLAQANLIEKLHVWHTHMDNYISIPQHNSTLSPVELRAIARLHIYYLVATIWLSACLDPTETIYDTLTPEFNAILDHTEVILSSTTAQISYTFEMGIIPPLYFTGWRCRIPHIRRRALRLLHQAPAQESLFHRDIEIEALTRIIEAEECLPRGTDLENVIGAVPADEARLRHVLIGWDLGTPANGNRSGKCRPHLIWSRNILKKDKNGRLVEVKPEVVLL